eukprot:10730045-Alexandrium_andersonii.AAC.1
MNLAAWPKSCLAAATPGSACLEPKPICSTAASDLRAGRPGAQQAAMRLHQQSGHHTALKSA